MFNICHQGLQWKQQVTNTHLLEWLKTKALTTQCWWGCGVRGIHVHCWWECKMAQSLWKTVWRFLTKWNIVFFFWSLFIYLWEREHKQRRGRERGRQKIPSRLHTVSSEPNVGLELTNREIMTRAEIQSWTFNWLSCPDTPPYLFCNPPHKC